MSVQMMVRWRASLLLVPTRLLPKLKAKSTSFNFALVSGAVLEVRSLSELYARTASTVRELNASSTMLHHRSPVANPIERAAWAEGKYGHSCRSQCRDVFRKSGLNF